MNIALVILRANGALGGAEGYTLSLAGSLIDAGHQVTLIAQEFGENLPATERVTIDAPGLTRSSRYLRFLDGLDKHLAANPYDVVHAMLPVRRCDLYHPHAGLAIDNIRQAHVRYNDPIRRTLAKLGARFNARRNRLARVERRLLEGPRPPVVLCLSKSMRHSVQDQFRIDPGRLITLYNGIRTERFDPSTRVELRQSIRANHGWNDDHVVGLIVGQDFELKGVAEAIRAIALVNDPRLTLLVVGRDNPRPYQRLAVRYGVERQVVFFGATTDVAACYAASDFLLFPSRGDTCGLVVLESLAMGRPVIVTRQAGASELVSDGFDGFVIDSPRNVAALAEATRELLDGELRRRMGEAGLSKRPYFSQQRHLSELMQAYEAAMAR